MKNTLILLMLSALFLMGCSKKNEDSTLVDTNPIEFITTMVITFVPEGGGDTIIFSSYDSDGWNGTNSYGEGPNTSASFAPNTSYIASIQLLNENETPVLNLTQEIINEGVEHQFIYSDAEPTIIIEYLPPFDTNNRPIGVNFKLTTGNMGCSQLLIKLLHQPPKDQPGAEIGEYTNLEGVELDDLDVYPSGCYGI